MEPLAMLQTDHLDLLFENRNKSYGAYTLKKYYPQRLMISMGITFSMVIISIVAYLYLHTTPLNTREFTIPETIIYPIVYLPKEKPILPPSKPFVPKPPASVQFTTPLIAPDPKPPGDG